MPGDCLALAVGVSRKVQGIGLLHRLDDIVDMLGIALDELVLHGEVMGSIDRTFLRYQVAYMAV